MFLMDTIVALAYHYSPACITNFIVTDKCEGDCTCFQKYRACYKKYFRHMPSTAEFVARGFGESLKGSGGAVGPRTVLKLVVTCRLCMMRGRAN